MMGKDPVHDRLYWDYFDRRANRELLLRHLQETGRGAVVDRAYCESVARCRDEREHWQENHHRTVSRLMVPAATTDEFEPRRRPAQPLSTLSLNTRPSGNSPPSGAPRPHFTPLITKYYSQLTPFTQTLSYSSGCDQSKILQSGKHMIRYTDSKAMFEALQQSRE